MIENISYGKYSEVVDSYTALTMSSSIRGRLSEKVGKSLRIEIGGGKALDIVLREDIDIKKGDTVLIDRKNILKSREINIDDVSINENETDIYTEKLKEIDIDVNEENIKIVKKLDNFGIDITKENFETYLLAKDSLNSVSNSLDYESAIRLVQMDVDIENISVDELSSLIEGLEEEKEGFKILNMFKKKELTTEEAEEIAKKLYGSKMGKDITDIIKSLHKRKVNITKKNVEKINDVFYKLDNLKEVEDKTFVDTIKNKLEINIENLYKVKRYVKDENLEVKKNEVGLNRLANINSYDTPKETRKVTEKELRLLEEDIKDLIEGLELEVTDNTIRLSKEFIKRDMEVTRENIETIDEMKVALDFIIRNIDKEVASELVKADFDMETVDLRVVAEKIKEIKNAQTSETVDLNEVMSSIKLEDITEDIEKLKKIEEKDILTLLEKNVDFKISKIEQVIFNKRTVSPINDFKDMTYELPNNPSAKQELVVNEIVKISNAFSDIGKLDLNTIAFQIKRNIPINIANIQANIQESNKFISLDNTKVNIQKTMEVFRDYQNIRENLTSNMVSKAVAENIEFVNMDISLASRYVNRYKMMDQNYKTLELNNTREAEKLAQMFSNNTKNIMENSEKNIMHLMKSNKPLSFGELKESDFLYRNKEQLGHKISELDEMVVENGNEMIKEKMESLKREIIDISKNFGKSREDLEKSNETIEKKIKDIEENMTRLNQEQNDALNKKTKEVSEKLDENKLAAKENKIIQMPFYMNGQFTNLNMYFRDKQRDGREKDLNETSVVISIDTVNMGNVNVTLDINKKDIDIKIGLESLDDKKHIEKYKPILKEFLERDDYKIRDIEFFKEGDKDSFVREENLEVKPRVLKGNLDITV